VAEVPDDVVEKATTMRVLFAEYVQHYGGMKALCEQAVENVLPGRTTNIRPGLIVGPRDRSDRFTYWPVRVANGGEVLAPGDGSDPVQWIDVRDLAEFTLDCAENGTMGVFSAITPAGWFTMAEMLHGIKAAMWTDAQFTWVSNEFLEENEVAAWVHMPVWIPAVEEYAGFHLVDTSKAVKAGLKFRPLADTTQATLEWVRSLEERRQASLGPDAVYPTPENREDQSIVKRRTGLSAKREAELLKAWHDREKQKTELPEQYD
jgi:2'-hydroxyisoflavone reductase